MRRTFIGHDRGITIGDEAFAKGVEVLPGEDIVTIAHDPSNPSRMLAGSYGRGLFKSSDAGRNWTHVPLDVQFVRIIVFSPAEPATVYVGIEPAELFRSRDAGETWECLHIRRLPEAARWSLPYSPRSGALRTFVPHPTKPAILYGGVEQGGVIRSADGGVTWSIDHRVVHPDVHWLAMSPSRPASLLAATGGGLFQTEDGCKSWTKLLDDYTRATMFDPREPSIALAAPAHEVGEHGRIIRSMDGGANWELASGGLKLPMSDMIEFFAPDPLQDRILGIGSEGGLLQSEDQGDSWTKVESVGGAQCLDFIEED